MKINVYQNYYQVDQLSLLDPDFIPHDNTSNENPEYREYWLFVKMYENGKHLDADFTGIVSQKFYEKTQIRGSEFISFVKQNRGFDVYFINPLPFTINAYAFKNVWHQGEFYHTGMFDFVQNLLNKLNYGIDLNRIRNSERTLLFSNFWVGNEYFWDEYIKFTKPFYDYLRSEITEDEKAFISREVDKIIKINYTPFIFERMFSTLLAQNPDIKALGYRYSNDYLHRLSSKERAVILFLRSIERRLRQTPNSPSRWIYERIFGLCAPLVRKVLKRRQEAVERNQPLLQS